MLELILSNTKTGYVHRKLVQTQEQADQYIERFLHFPGLVRPRNLCEYRVEVQPLFFPEPAAVSLAVATDVSRETAA